LSSFHLYNLQAWFDRFAIVSHFCKKKMVIILLKSLVKKHFSLALSLMLSWYFYLFISFIAFFHFHDDFTYFICFVKGLSFLRSSCLILFICESFLSHQHFFSTHFFLIFSFSYSPLWLWSFLHLCNLCVWL
jgi:hypothetical protein